MRRAAILVFLVGAAAAGAGEPEYAVRMSPPTQVGERFGLSGMPASRQQGCEGREAPNAGRNLKHPALPSRCDPTRTECRQSACTGFEAAPREAVGRGLAP